jgi:hypothetical protein
VVVLVVCLVASGVMGLSPTANSSAASGPTAQMACYHLFEKELSSPCRVGNELITCGYVFGACESSSHLKCKLSAEEGKVVKFMQEPKEDIEGQRIENPHKTVTCKGSATILAVYYWENGMRGHHFEQVRQHGTHSLTVTLYARSHGFRDDGLSVMAQS